MASLHSILAFGACLTLAGWEQPGFGADPVHGAAASALAGSNPVAAHASGSRGTAGGGWGLAQETDPVEDDFNFAQMLQRDKGVSFPPQAGGAALDVLQGDVLDPKKRASALLTLGETETSSGRTLVEAWMKRGTVDERVAAIIAWGRMGTFLGGEDPFLVERLGDSELEVAEAALYALYLHTPKSVLERLAFLIARPDEPLFRAAVHITEWHERGTVSEPGPVTKHLEMRWMAARDFGTIDGQLWSAHLIETLCGDPDFLDACIMPIAGDMVDPRVRDHLLELLQRDPAADGPAVAALACMPGRLDQIVEAGLWIPKTDSQRQKIVELAEQRGSARLIPNTLARMALQPAFTLKVAGWLAGYDIRYQEVIEENLRTQDPLLRALAARAAGQSGLSEWVVRLQDLSQDPEPAVQLEALIARVRAGDEKAEVPLAGYFFQDRDTVSNGVRERAMQLMLEARNGRVLDLAEQIHSGLRRGYEKACLSAILLQGGRRVSTDSIMVLLKRGVRPDRWHLQMIRALGMTQGTEELEFLESVFPHQGPVNLNIELAKALMQRQSEAALPIIKNAIWKGDFNRSYLASSVLAKQYGSLRLMQWLERPPSNATTEDLRRVGFIIGSLGGLNAVEVLASHLGSVVGVDRPELQGAMLGALSARTY